MREPAKERVVRRWQHEAVIDAMLDRLARAPDGMTIRRRTRVFTQPRDVSTVLAASRSMVTAVTPRNHKDPGHDDHPRQQHAGQIEVITGSKDRPLALI